MKKRCCCPMACSGSSQPTMGNDYERPAVRGFAVCYGGLDCSPFAVPVRYSRWPGTLDGTAGRLYLYRMYFSGDFQSWVFRFPRDTNPRFRLAVPTYIANNGFRRAYSTANSIRYPARSLEKHDIDPEQRALSEGRLVSPSETRALWDACRIVK